MLLAELQIWYKRPITPTRRIALGHLVLPTDPAPGLGGVLLAAVMTAASSREGLPSGGVAGPSNRRARSPMTAAAVGPAPAPGPVKVRRPTGSPSTTTAFSGPFTLASGWSRDTNTGATRQRTLPPER